MRVTSLIRSTRSFQAPKAGILAPDVFWTGEAKGIVVAVQPDMTRLQAHNLTAAKVEQAIAKAQPKAIALGNLVYLLPRDGGAEVAQAIRKVVVTAFPGASVDYKVDPKRQGIVDSWPADVDVGAARTDWGFAPQYDFERAFRDYLIPSIRDRYRTSAKL